MGFFHLIKVDDDDAVHLHRQHHKLMAHDLPHSQPNVCAAGKTDMRKTEGKKIIELLGVTFAIVLINKI